MDQRLRFVADCQRRFFSFFELCERFGVSRKTGYKWLKRYEKEGPPGLVDRSRRPQSCPHQTAARLVEALLEARRRHPSWGPKKLIPILARKHPSWKWPALSTCSAVIQRHGLIQQRRRRRHPGHPGRPTTPMTEPNEIWTADFKGEFKTRDGIYCYPLTVADGYSRYLLACQGLRSTKIRLAQPVFRRLFVEYGLPRIIRTDNGVPFATTALGRLSTLSVWWIRLGIFPELIEPASPQQNGSHERMHKTLKADTTIPPAATLRGRQQRFNRFKDEYNNVRPHEALDQETPASCYKPSPRPYPSRLPQVEYPDHFEKRLVSRNGGFRWLSERVPLTHTLEGQYVGLEEVDDGKWDVYFGHVRLGQLDERTFTIQDALGRRSRRRKV